MSTEHIKSRHEPKLFERIKFAFSAFVAVLLNRPIIICIGEGTIYARSNPYYMRAFSKMMADACEYQDLSELEARIKKVLTEIPDERKN